MNNQSFSQVSIKNEAARFTKNGFLFQTHAESDEIE
jgi:hypothetical protein